jgi:hypothetical protein
MTARSDSQKDRPAAEWPPWWIRDGQFRDGETKKRTFDWWLDLADSWLAAQRPSAHRNGKRIGARVGP